MSEDRNLVSRLWVFLAILPLLSSPLGLPALSGAEERTSKEAATNPWAEAMLALRAQRAAEPPAEFRLGPWYTTGHLAAKGFQERLFPESGVSLDARGDDGIPLWSPRPQFEDGRVESLPGSASGSTYLFRKITTPSDRRLEVSLGSDDGLEVFLRGESVLSRNVARGVSPDQDRVTLELKAGENDLLLKIYNQGGGHGFYFSCGPNPDATLWRQIEEKFPREAAWMREDSGGAYLSWLCDGDGVELEARMVRKVLDEIGTSRRPLMREYRALARASSADPVAWLSLYARCAKVRHRLRTVQETSKDVDLESLRRAIDDLAESYPEKYTRGPEFRERLDAGEKKLAELAESETKDLEASAAVVQDLLDLRREALLENPLLDFDRLLVVKRRANQLGLPQNWQGNCALPRGGYDNEIATLAVQDPDARLRTVYRPEKDSFVGDVDLHSSGDRMLFSSIGSHGRWQIFEVDSRGENLRQVNPGTYPDVDNYDACYLPDERIIFGSTRCFAGVPCVGGGNTVANLFIMNRDGTGIRQLCFDQDHNWCPTVLNDGRVLYSRWEYSDSPHYFTRLLFHMNPDGTNQTEYYGSNSMWPNSIFYARPIPGHPTQVVAVISGHHGVPRMGELVLFDPARGRHQAEGAVQRIPGYGKRVEPTIQDQLVNGSWPRFLHPYPLSEKYFLVSCQPTPSSQWGVYLVDVFDNMLLLRDETGYALLEPIPLRETTRPPVIPDKIDPDSREATVYLSDVYAGKGLRDVPRGTVKKLRVYEFHYAYPGMGGHINIGIDGPWDARRILGTVPVFEDGSAVFRVPANTPIAVQPLDGEGRSLQIMRSWFTAMPGEKLSCAGCHESQNSTPAARLAEAAIREPSAITPWYGPARGFSFSNEVQPVLDRYCVACHNPEHAERPDFTAKSQPGWRNFTPSYIALHPYVRRPGPESDYFAQQPLEYHASTSELVQMLEKGHHGVKLDREAWDRLFTWIDLNVPDHGTWSEHRRGHSPFEERRREMRTLFANRPEDPEATVEVERPPIEPIVPETPQEVAEAGVGTDALIAWAFNDAGARERVVATGFPERFEVRLSPESTVELVLIPAGEFVMGDPGGDADESPPTRVKIEKPFYMSVCEVTNAQYALFDPSHDSAYISMTNKDHSERGHAINGPSQPVVRITWNQAVAFCDWLATTAQRSCRLPTEAEWEWACRAGTTTPFFYGDLDADFGRFANLADTSLERFARGDSPKWHPRDGRFNDRAFVTTNVGQYRPNAWGLHDMHGNVAEWTSGDYVYYARGDIGTSDGSTRKVVRGGSWYDRPHRARSSFRLAYPPWQRVFNVGFRVVLEVEAKAVVQASR